MFKQVAKTIPTHYRTNISTSLEGKAWKSTTICKFNEDPQYSGSSSIRGAQFLEAVANYRENSNN
jgi:hypothetical protein